MGLDRELQLEILRKLAEKYPNRLDVFSAIKADHESMVANLHYLEEHGLIVSGLVQFMGGRWGGTDSKATADGMDFLEQDGGLSAALGVVTVRLHDNTIKDLIATKVMESALEPDDKKKYLDQLKSLPADATKHLAMKLLDLGVEKIQTGALSSLIDSVVKAFG